VSNASLAEQLLGPGLFVHTLIPHDSCKVLILFLSQTKPESLPIFFTPKQVNEVLPHVRKIVETVIAIKKEVDGTTADDTIIAARERLQKEIEKLEELGCVLKDMNTGLLDFPAVRMGVRVWLCWKLGEERVSFWHGLHEGLAGRKAIQETEFYDENLAVKSLTGSGSKSQSKHL